MQGKRPRKRSAGKRNRRWRRFERFLPSLLRHVRLWIVLLFVVLIVVALLFLLFSPTFAVASIRVSREDRRIDVEEIQQFLAPQFGRHILFVSPMLLSREIQLAYPEVAEATVRRRYPNEIIVRLAMDAVAADVLIGEPDNLDRNLASLVEEVESIASEERVYRYVTEQGIYLEYPFALEEQGRSLSLHLVDWATKPEHQQALLSQDVLRTMRQAKGILEQSFGLTVPAVTLYLRAKEFHVHTIHPGRSEGKEMVILWFDFESPMVQQMNRYRAFLRSISPEKVEEYVDLRLQDRVVFR